jgi:hypothetical protein
MSELPVAKDADFPTADNPAYWGFSRGALPGKCVAIYGDNR